MSRMTRVVVLDQHEVDLHALAGIGLVEGLGDAFAVGLVGDLGLGLREVVLVVGVLDVGEQVASPADQVETSAKQIPGRSHLGRIDVGLRRFPPRSSVAILKASTLSFLAFAPWMAFM